MMTGTSNVRPNVTFIEKSQTSHVGDDEHLPVTMSSGATDVMVVDNPVASARRLYRYAVSSVVTQQVQDSASQERELSIPAPLAIDIST